MKYVNSFMRTYRVVMEEKARQNEYMRNKEFERILKQQHERLKRLDNKNNKN
jgi:hypothetical protein